MFLFTHIYPVYITASFLSAAVATMSTPVISAPTLVTSTNPVTATAACCTPPVTPPKEEWRSKYLEAKGNCRKLKAQMREQAKKSRQLIVAVKNKLQEEENEKLKVTLFSSQAYEVKHYFNHFTAPRDI